MELSEATSPAQGPSIVTGDYYDPSLEWPGEDTIFGPACSETDLQVNSSDSSKSLKSGQPVFRLLVLQSSILPKNQKIAVIDAYPEAQIGRDVQPQGSVTPRIRLKEMEVSKFHATAYWDGSRKEWNLVDMGSMHGTYIRSGPVAPDSKDVGVRLSQPRSASLPRRLRHSDQLTIGGTVFEAHIHDNQRPCQQCTISGREEIPLFPSSNKSLVKRTRDVAGLDVGPSKISRPLENNRDPKRALNALKRSLLTRHDVSNSRGSFSASPSVSVDKQPEYVDRAARRRLLQPSSRPDTPGVSNINPPAHATSIAPVVDVSEPLPPPCTSSAPHIPLPSTNIGHRLLMQQGWSPGNALGTTPDPSEGRVGLIDPLEVKRSENRAGLGMKRPSTVVANMDDSTIGLSWKDQEKFKRFKLEGLR